MEETRRSRPATFWFQPPHNPQFSIEIDLVDNPTILRLVNQARCYTGIHEEDTVYLAYQGKRCFESARIGDYDIKPGSILTLNISGTSPTMITSQPKKHLKKIEVGRATLQDLQSIFDLRLARDYMDIINDVQPLTAPDHLLQYLRLIAGFTDKEFVCNGAVNTLFFWALARARDITGCETPLEPQDSKTSSGGTSHSQHVKDDPLPVISRPAIGVKVYHPQGNVYQVSARVNNLIGYRNAVDGFSPVLCWIEEARAEKLKCARDELLAFMAICLHARRPESDEDLMYGCISTGYLYRFFFINKDGRITESEPHQIFDGKSLQRLYSYIVHILCSRCWKELLAADGETDYGERHSADANDSSLSNWSRSGDLNSCANSSGYQMSDRHAEEYSSHAGNSRGSESDYLRS